MSPQEGRRPPPASRLAFASVALVTGLVLAGLLSTCSSDDGTAATSTSPSTAPAPTTSTTPIEKFCASMRVVADFESSLRSAGEDGPRLAALYATANADHQIEDAYDSANGAVPVDRPEVKVALNYGELFTGRISSAFAEGAPAAEANAPRTDADWIGSQPVLDGYTQQNCGFTVYAATSTTGG